MQSVCVPNSISLNDHSQLMDLSLNNLDIYPFSFTTTPSEGCNLDWANLNLDFMESESGNCKDLEIHGHNCYTTQSPFSILSLKKLSGIATTSNPSQVLNVMKNVTQTISQEGDLYIIKLIILSSF